VGGLEGGVFKMAMIPSYQDMLAQALQQQPQQQQVMGQSQQSKSIFNNPAFGNALTRMGVTMLANSGQGLSTGEALGQGGLAFLDEQQRYAQQQRQAMLDQQQKQIQDAQLARAQLQDNLSRLSAQREAMQYDAAAQQAQNLPKEYQGLAVLDPLGTVKLAATNAFNQQEAERDFAQKVQLQNMQYGNQRALEEYKARQSGGMGDMPAAVKEYLFYQSQNPEQQETFLNLKRQNPQDKRISGEYGDRFTAITSAPEIAKSRQQKVENILAYYNEAPGWQTGIAGGALPALTDSAQLADKESAQLNVEYNPFKGQGAVSDYEQKMKAMTIPNRSMRRETLARTQLASQALTDIADFRRNFANEYVNKTGKWDSAGEKELFDAAGKYSKQRYLELFPEDQPKWSMAPVKGGK
jgi:hypothetical protein